MSLVPSSSSLCDQVRVLLQSLDDLKGVIALPMDCGADASTVTPTVAPTGDSRSLSDRPVASLDVEVIHKQIAQLQPSFHQLLQCVAQADLEPLVGQRLRAYQTEAHRRLRLLSVEAMKLRTAKQPATLTRSQSQLQAHLAQLQQFIQAMADEVCSS